MGFANRSLPICFPHGGRNPAFTRSYQPSNDNSAFAGRAGKANSITTHNSNTVETTWQAGVRMSSNERSSDIIVLQGPALPHSAFSYSARAGNNARTPPWRAIGRSRASLFGRGVLFREQIRISLALLARYADENRILDTAKAFYARLVFPLGDRFHQCGRIVEGYGLLMIELTGRFRLRSCPRNISSAGRWLMRDPARGRRNYRFAKQAFAAAI